jgi:hypothetical protein
MYEADKHPPYFKNSLKIKPPFCHEIVICVFLVIGTKFECCLNYKFPREITKIILWGKKWLPVVYVIPK